MIIIFTGVLLAKLSPGGWEAKMTSPFAGRVETTTPAPTPVPTPNAPKTFKFDGSTDLKMELDKVNPEVLDSDFE